MAPPPGSPDRKGGSTSLSLNGTSQYAQGAAIPTSASTVSMTAWVKWNGGSGLKFVMYNGGSGSTGYGMYLDNGIFKVLCAPVGYVVTNATIPTGQWTHLAAVYKHSTWTLYVNGASVPIVSGANLTPVAPNPATNYVTIGKDNSTNYFNGLIDDVRIYNSPLASSAIAAMASDNDSERYTARWLFNSDATDNSGFRRHAWSLNNLSYATDRVEGTHALSLNGTNAYALMPLSNFSTKNFAMSAWVKWNGSAGLGQTQRFIFHNGNAGSNGYGMFIQNDGTFRVICGGVGYVVSSATVPVGQWSWVAATYIDSVWTLYVNGNAVPIVSGASTVPNTPTGSTSVGTDGGTMYFNGLIDDLRLYNTK